MSSKIRETKRALRLLGYRYSDASVLDAVGSIYQGPLSAAADRLGMTPHGSAFVAPGEWIVWGQASNGERVAITVLL